MERLYIVTRRDLEPGAQVAQTGHAISAFAVAHPDAHRQWHEHGKNLICLAAKDEAELRTLMGIAELEAAFTEPDFGDALTAVALSGDAQRRLSSFPKALKQPRPDDGRCHDCH